jgi:hypothetical protein
MDYPGILQFRVNCECGNQIVVKEGSAGARIACPCGRSISVPSLKELRIQAGLPPYELSPELVIEHLLAAGELPFGKTCVQCQQETDEIIQVNTECERAWVHRTGGFSWGTLLFSMFVLPIRIWFWERREETVYGKDKIYPLPLRVCQACQRTLRRQRAIKECLRRIPEYDRLLDKFPDAVVRWARK